MVTEWTDARHNPPFKMDPSFKIGHIHVFSKIAVFGSDQDVRDLARGKRSRLKMGSFLGKIKGVIPVDPHRVIYIHHTHTEAFKKRRSIRTSRRKLGVTRKEARSLQKLTGWLR